MIDTILVVEDEKMIRQGIATMIRRCEGQVGEVLECPDGEKALEILKSRPVDLVFTDIRMPKMNGIQLVQKMQALDEVPMAVAISGYDDFDYAVQMLRRGVKEYILKPVEREKIKEIITRLDEELERKKKDRDLTESRSSRLLRYLLLDKDADPGQMEDVKNILVSHVGQDFYVMVAVEPVALKGMCIPANGEMICIYPAAESEQMLKENADSYAGVSDRCGDVNHLKKAYEQALARRRCAFISNTGLVREDGKAAPDRLVKEAGQLTQKAFISAAVQKLGASPKEALKDFERFMKAAERGYIPYEVFENTIRIFCSEFTSVYKRQIPEQLICPFTTGHLSGYIESFLAFFRRMSEALSANAGDSETDRKMREAVAYIRENYKKDLSMTVVSNEVSMNYTLFSAQFKQYTGSNFVNFVRDLRITEAKRLLSETDLMILEVGAVVGYENEKHFLKSFKAVVGVTPSEYRKNTKITQ